MNSIYIFGFNKQPTDDAAFRKAARLALDYELPAYTIGGEDEYLNIMSTNPEKIEEIRAAYGLDADFFTQFVRYLKKTAALDFGSSFRTKAPVLDTILFRGKWTLYLALPTIVISGLIGGFTGLLCGWGEEKWYDRLVTRVFLLVNTIPSNCLAILFLIAFAFRLKWFPIGGITSGGLSGWARTADIFRHIQLPLIVLILYRLDEPTSMLDVISQAQIIALLRTLQAEQGLGFLFISHDIELMCMVCERIHHLENGVIAETENCRRAAQPA